MIRSDSLMALSAAAAMAIAAAIAKSIRAKGAGSAYFIAFLGSVLGLLVCDFLELSGADDAGLLLCSRIGCALIAFAPVFWFLFAARYSLGCEAGRPLLRAALFVVPSATAALAFLDPKLYAIWPAGEIRADGISRAGAALGYGPWFWVYASYSYLLFAGGVFLILREIRGNFAIYRRQAALLLCGIIIPAACKLCCLLRLFPGRTRDYSTIALAVSGLLFSLALSKYKLLDLSPPARESLGDYLDEGALFVDGRGRILYCNKAGATMLRGEADELIGRPLADALPGGAAPVDELLAPGGGVRSVEIDGGGRALELSAKADPSSGAESPRYFVSLRAESLEPADHAARADLAGSLSNREMQIARLLAKGASHKEIAAKLFVSTNTVKTHIRHIYRKAGVSTRRELRSAILGDRAAHGAGRESP
jgi:DNA-binding CsgD family transcriptional regulator